MYTPYNVLIIGAGQVGAFYDCPGGPTVRTHAHAFSASPFFNLLGFLDKDPIKAREAAERWSCQAFESLDEVMANAKPDVVSVATPDSTHYALLKELSSWPLQLVFAEKPLVASYVEAKIIVDLYRKQDISLAVNYIRRYEPAFEILKQYINSGEMGHYIYGTGYYGKGLLHNGSHMLDLLLYLLGPFTPGSLIDQKVDYLPEDPSISGWLSNASGARFNMQAVDCGLYTIFELDLFFEKGRIRILDGGEAIEYYNIVTYDAVPGYQVPKLEKLDHTSISIAMAHAADNIHRHLAGMGSLKCTGEEALSVIGLCEQFRMAPRQSGVSLL